MCAWARLFPLLDKISERFIDKNLKLLSLRLGEAPHGGEKSYARKLMVMI
jgi:hypothetical protein